MVGAMQDDVTRKTPKPPSTPFVFYNTFVWYSFVFVHVEDICSFVHGSLIN
jgi:hypothetical protein